MAITNGAPVVNRTGDTPTSQRGEHVKRRWWPAALIVFAVLSAVAVVLLARNFPFSQKNVTQSLLETFPGTLKIDHFQAVYFPHPGCIADGVSFRSTSNAAGSPPMVTILKLTIQGSYADFLIRPHHISRVVLEGLRVQIPQIDGGSNFSGGYAASQITTGEIIANGAVLEIARANDNSPLRFDIHELNLESVSAKYGMSYRVSMHNPEPPGEIKSTGHLGPLNTGEPGQTKMSGTYSFSGGDLSAFHGIAGIVSSEGKFSGPLARVEVRGTTDIPDFEVVRSGHSARLVTRFEGLVDGQDGDITLNSVNASYIGTEITARGTIADKNGMPGKFTSLDLAIRDGRIQDLLRLFVMEDRPPMSGVASLKVHVMVPPEGKPFLKEVALDGDFEIASAHFVNASRQESVNKLSETARGQKNAQPNEDKKDPADNVESHMQGHTLLRNGVATFTTLSYTVPGADAQMHGTYNLMNEKIDFHGTLKMDAKFSQSTSGVKALFAKVLDPFFNKKHGSVIPVVMDGTYHQPHFGIDLNPINK